MCNPFTQDASAKIGQMVLEKYNEMWWLNGAFQFQLNDVFHLALDSKNKLQTYTLGVTLTPEPWPHRG